jgi:undecaprenyl-diphosphatase
MLRIVQLGDMIPVAAMTCVLMALCLATRRPPAAVLVAVAVPGAGAISEFLLKPLLHRTLGGALSFPSGHATGIVALAVTLAVLMLNPHRPRLPGCLRATIALGGLGAAGVIGVAIVGARTHYATDAIGGMTVATSVVLLTALIVDWFMAARLGRDR